jgi:hypothetical protein
MLRRVLTVGKVAETGKERCQRSSFIAELILYICGLIRLILMAMKSIPP